MKVTHEKSQICRFHKESERAKTMLTCIEPFVPLNEHGKISLIRVLQVQLINDIYLCEFIFIEK